VLLLGTYFAVTLLLLWPGMSTAFRAGVLVIVCAGSGIAQLLHDAPHGAGYQIALASTVLAGLMLRRKTATWCVLSIIGLVFVVTGLYGFGVLASDDPRAGGIAWWLSWSMSFAVLAITLMLIQQYISGHLVQSLAESRRQRAELARANAAKGELLAVVSHELRTPLTPVMLSLAMLRQDERLPEDVRQELAMAYGQVELEACLIGDLLDLTHMVSHQFTLKRSLHDLHALIRDAIARSQTDLDVAHVEVALDLKASESLAQVDSVRFARVVRHLLGNSMQFCPAGGRLNVTTCNSQRYGTTCLTMVFRDNGVGFAPGQAGRILAPFEQADRTTKRKFGGLGIGLAICKNIVDLHGGCLNVTSNGEDEGCDVTIDFPLNTQ